MLKIIYKNCFGMNVHKSFAATCIATTNDLGVTTYKSKRFSTFTGDLRRCAVWLSENSCRDIYMESTGKYWIPIYNILEPTCNLVLAHPKYVKSIRGKKTGKRMPNGLLTSSSTTLFPAVLFLQQISGSCETWLVIIGS